MKKIAILFSIISIIFISCKDENISQIPQIGYNQSTQDYLHVQNIYNDVIRTVYESFDENISSTCLNYLANNNDTSDVDTLILIFNNDCVYNNKIRSGKIIIKYTGLLTEMSSLFIINFDNYYINGNSVKGEIEIENKGLTNDNIYYSIKITNGVVDQTNGGSVDIELNETREWVNGSNTNNVLDDIYKITGNSIGNGANNRSFTSEIIDTLYFELGCSLSSECFIKSGTIRISPDGYSDRMINYGEDLCDCNLILTIDNQDYPFMDSPE